MPDVPQPDLEIDCAVDVLLAEFNGNARAAIAALLHDLDVLARDAVSVSRGFVRHEKQRVAIVRTVEPE